MKQGLSLDTVWADRLRLAAAGNVQRVSTRTQILFANDNLRFFLLLGCVMALGGIIELSVLYR